jgi:hypothetical protein
LNNESLTSANKSLICLIATPSQQDSAFLALKQKIDCDQALAWLRDEGLLDHVDLGPPVSP